MIKTLTSCLSWFAGMLRMRLVVFVCVSPFGAVTLLTFRLLIGQKWQRSGSIMGFDSLSCLHLVFQGHPLTGIIFTTLATFATQSFSLSLSLLFSLEVFLTFLMFTWSLPLSSPVCLVCLSLFNSFILVNVYILYLLSFSFVMLFFFNSLKLLMFTFSHFLRVCLKSSELPNIGSFILRQHTNWKETFLVTDFKQST